MKKGAEEAEVIVIGAGVAGFSAAIAAADAGASVTVLEKGSHSGGNAIYSGGSFVFAGTDMQHQAGIHDDPEGLRADLLRIGGRTADPELIDAYITHQLETFEWMRSVGVQFDSVLLSGNQTVPRSHGVRVRQMFDALQAAVDAHPKITQINNARVERLLESGDHVTGISASTPDGMLDFTADSIIIATGGFGRSPRTLATFAPRLLDAIPLGDSESTGDGLYLGMSVGADLANMGSILGTFGTSASFPGTNPNPILLIALYRGAIIVNTEGARFTDESKSYKLIADECLQQPGAMAFQIFDQRVMEQSRDDKLVNNFAGALESGHLICANDIATLEQAIGVPAGSLAAEIDAYNESISAGTPDPWQRESLGSGYGDRTPVEAGPYYAYPCTVGLPSTYGGLKVDREMRLIHVQGMPIAGLYAAGETTGGFHGSGYMSGTSLGKSAIFGRLAGRNAAAQQRPAIGSIARYSL